MSSFTQNNRTAAEKTTHLYAKLMNNREGIGSGNLISCLKRAGQARASGIAGKKIAIPSDLSVHLLAFSVNVRNPCEFQSPKPKGFRRMRLFRASATTLKFQANADEPCGTPMNA
jgi:hypothetical protein